MAHSSKMAINKFLKLIQAEHQKYFVSEDEAVKEEKYQPLRNSIKQYLGLVQNDNRFTNDAFAQLFKYNFEKKPDFNVKDGQQAFDNLHKYASNLMSYPWRKEFHSVKLYCGFFKHQVARHLLKADTVLRLMGYNPSSNTANCLIMEEPLDPDKLIMVSLNCLIASCECEVIQEIYTIVRSSKCSCTYKEIYTIRQTISNTQAIAKSFCSKDRMENSSPIVSKISLKNENNSLHHFGKNERNLKKDAKVGQLIDISPITTSTPETKKKQILPDDLYDDESGRSKDYLMHRSSQANNIVEHKKFENEVSKYVNVVSSQGKEKMAIDESDNLKFHTNEDRVKSGVAAVREYRKQDPEEIPPTRENSWGYVDQNLQSRGLNRGYANRNDVLDDVAVPTKVEKELEMMRRKSRESDQLQFQQQLQLNQFQQQQQLPHFHGTPMVPPNPPEYVHYNYPHPVQPMIPPHYYPYPILYNSEMMRNATLTRNMHPMHDYPPEMQQWMHMQNQYMCYPPTPATATVDGSAALPNNFVSAMQAVNLIDNSRVENGTGTRSQETNTPLSDPSEENRRSLYDNVQPDHDGRALDLYNTSNYLPGIIHPHMMNIPRVHQLPHMAGLQGRPMEAATDFYSSEPRHKMYHRKDSQSLTDEQVESDAPVKLKHQFEKNQSKVDNSDVQYSGSEKEKNSPVPRQSRSVTPSVHSSSKRNSQCSSESAASGWECKHCTFLNPGDKKICDICGRSKVVGPESRPLQCGGHECPKCTLINDINARTCMACATNLENSPTYL